MAEPSIADTIEELAELERRAAGRATSEAQRHVSRQRFLARLDAEPRSPRAPWLRVGLPLFAAACLSLAVFLLLRAPALTFRTRGAELSGRYVSAPASNSAELRFSDDSTVVAAAGTRLRVEETSPRGARILLERGRASVHVVHEGSTAWTFASGPFEVRVTGTRFDLAWDPARETCDLRLYEGSVEVRGPTGSGPMVVKGGQHFQGDAQRRTMQVLDLEPAATVDAATPPALPSAGSSAAPALAPPTLSTEKLAATNEHRAVSWPQLIGQGKFKDVVREAEARGSANCLTSCAAADLRALSDAARYTGNDDLAERSLIAYRRRFGGAGGAEAAFLLGRMQEKRGAMSVARGWYESYWAEAPSGSFAAEALAGKLRAVQASQGRAAAAPVAREYLRRFPKGVHVSTARETLGEK